MHPDKISDDAKAHLSEGHVTTRPYAEFYDGVKELVNDLKQELKEQKKAETASKRKAKIAKGRGKGKAKKEEKEEEEGEKEEKKEKEEEEKKQSVTPRIMVDTMKCNMAIFKLIPEELLLQVREPCETGIMK